MAEVEISPLAKRLAEENNVDWRRLSGSGDEGRIVERDVLDYLARVMAGDEAPDPTPEPLPDGLEQWPDQPMVTGEGGGSRQPAGSSAPATWEGDDGLLEVESAGEAPAAAAESGAGNDWSSGDWGNGDWGAGGSDDGPPGAVDTDGFFAGSTAYGSGTGHERGSEVDFGSEVDDTADSDYDFGSGSTGFGGVSSSEPAIDEGIFLFDDEDDPALAQGAQVAAGAAETDNLFDLDEEERPAAASVGEGGEAPQSDESEFDAEHTPWEGGTASATEVEEEVAASDRSGGMPWEEEDEGSSDLPASDAPWTAVEEEAPAAESKAESPRDEGGGAQLSPWADAPGVELSEAGDTSAPSSHGLGNAPEETGEEYDYLDGLGGSPPDGVRIEEDEHRIVRSATEGGHRPVAAEALAKGGVDIAGGPEATRAPVPAPPTARGMVAAGIVLRRDVDLSGVVQARQAVTAEIGEQGSLAAFLVRAAARAGHPWPLGNEAAQVGLATLSDDGVGVSIIAEAARLPFRDLIHACASGSDSGGDASLVVADLSEMGIDEAVLDLGRPVLTVGRVLDEGNGRFHATLTLSGLTTPEAGSRFLARVVELLAAPVRLVL